ncbi:MAG TPA: S8 family serine peptidase [Candidatus Acidoferrales bacterium]|nr:S8 family serine peptidase [Candidatus Acidoferrales bacterium]
MKTYCSLIKPWRVAVCAAGLLIIAGVPTAAWGQTQHSLSASAQLNARQQIQALMADKARWSKAQQKLDSQLIFQARFKATGLVHPAAPKLRPALTAELDGRIKVDIKGTVTPDLLAAIHAAGGTVLSSLPTYHFVQAVLPIENLEGLAARNDIAFIEPAHKARQNYVDSEGDYTHQAIEARADYPAAGAGIKVGILSDSIDNGSNALAEAVFDGNIDPNNTFVIPGQAGTGEGEGLAMCEVVHDLAPKATIYFATGAAGAAQMASNIVALAQAGCRIIADDEFYDDESPFQDAVIAQAVDTVSDMGVLYFSCARNSGNLDSFNSSTWQGDFVSGGSAGVYGTFLNFGDGVVYNNILSGGYDFEADLFWSDPLGASTNDYDLYMLDSLGDIVYSSQNVQNGTQDPYEHIDDPAQYSYGYYLAVTLYSGTSRFMHLDFGRGIINYATRGCIRGHNACDAANSFTVAATPAFTAYATSDPTGPYPYAFNSSDVVEYFSADGPRRMFYNKDGTAITPGNYSSTGGKVLYKPDFTAADGVTTTPPGFAPFFGTSCATPHAAAIAALVLSYNPSLTPGQMRNILTNSCIDIMAAGWDPDSGSGILMAPLALQHTPAAPAPNYFVPGSMSYSESGQFRAALAGAVGSNYVISVSSNLLTWSTLTTLTMTNTSSIFTDTQARSGRRFYRSQLAP